MRVRALFLLTIFILGTHAGKAETQENSPNAELLKRKLKLGAVLLERLKEGDTAKLNAELADLESLLEQGELKQVSQNIDGLVARISDKYRARSGRQQERVQMDRVRYLARKSELDLFKEGFDAELAEQNADMEPLLNRFSFDTRVKRAEELAESGQYSAAYLVLEGAYNQLLYAIKGLRDNQTVEYKLVFNSPQEEYEYEQRRYNSQRLLLAMTMQERELNSDTRERLRSGMEKAASMHAKADALAAENLFHEAIKQEEEAIDALGSLLQLVGYFF